MHTHTHMFNGPLSRTTRVSRYQMTTPALHHSVFNSWIPFLLPNQQRHSTEGKLCIIPVKYNFELHLYQRIHNTVFFYKKNI